MLRDELIALAKEWAPQCTHAADISGEQKEYMDAYIESAFETVFPIVARLALEDAAKVCEQKWHDGYRGEINAGFAHVIRALRDELA